MVSTGSTDAGRSTDGRAPQREGRGGPDPGPRRQPAGRDALPARRGGGAAAVPARGAALPQGRPHVVVRRRATARSARSTGTPCAGSTSAAPGPRPGDAAGRVPGGRAARPARRDRLAGRPGLVRRSGRDVGHVVLRLQLPPDRLRAAAGAQGDLRDLRHRRPLDRRRALARRRAAAGRPRRLRPLHDADVRAAAGAGGLGRRLARRVAAAARDLRAVGADLAAGEPARALLGPRLGAARRHDRRATSGSSAR